MAKKGKNKNQNDDIIGSFLLNEVLVKPSKQDKANLIASRVSKNISNFGSDYVLPIMSSLPIPGEELAMLVLGKGLSAIRNSKVLKPLFDHIIFKSKRFKDNMKELIKHQYYNSNLSWITKPNKDNYFRTVRTKDALEDVIDTGIIRAKSKILKDYDPYAYLSKVFPNSAPYFAKGRPMNGKYNLTNFGDYIIEVSNKHPFVGSVNMKVREPSFNRYMFDAINADFNKHHSIDTWVVPKETLEYQDYFWRIGDTNKHISIDDVENFYVSDWFRGMKPINPKTYKPKEKVNQFINMSDENALIRGLIKYENQQEKLKGGMVQTLKGRRRRYAIGGTRDSVNSITGNSWGAEKGIVGAEVGKSASKGIGIGAGTGAAIGSIIPGIGTVIGGAIGALAGLFGGLFKGGFAGRKKKRKAKEAAIKADMTNQYEVGMDAIRNDQAALDQQTINTNPIDMYGDNPMPQGGTQTIAGTYNQFGNNQQVNPNTGVAFRCGGKHRYDAGGSINQVASNAAIVSGPKHEQGGVPYGTNAEVEGGEAILNGSNADYIFSDTLKIGGRTFADMAKPLMIHKGYLEDKLATSGNLLTGLLKLTERSRYSIDRNTNGRNAEKQSARHYKLLNEINSIQAKLNELYNQQEAMKAEAGEMSEPKQEFEFGGSIRRFFDGGGARVQPMQTSSLDMSMGLAKSSTPMDMSLNKMNPGELSPIKPTGLKGASAQNAMGLGVSALGMIADTFAENAAKKRQGIVAGLPDHIRNAVVGAVGMRCGGKVKREAGGSVQISPFIDLGKQENTPTAQMIAKPTLYAEANPIVDIKRTGGPVHDPYTLIEDYDAKEFEKVMSKYEFEPKTKIKTNRFKDNSSRERSDFFDVEKGNILKTLGNLAGSIMSAQSSKAKAKAYSKMSVPKRELLDRIEQEWDINTDASRREVIDQVSAMEDFVKSNTSSAPIARQLMLMARSKGAANLGKLRQDELAQEMDIRNKTRQMNAEIKAKNKEIKYYNDSENFKKNVYALEALTDANNSKGNIIGQLFKDLGFMVNDKRTVDARNANSLIALLANDKMHGFLKNVDARMLKQIYGKNYAKLAKQISKGN